ncbi:MAG: class I SAM-dependent methyltransferase [Candidatus Omnitrophota bacterium]|nr:class I SAM-dependent methyltransferase [Candidatus Omnitrophota bacterium]
MHSIQTIDKPTEFYSALEKEETACVLCGSLQHVLVSNRDRYHMGIRTVMCRQCGLVFTNPRPSQKAMRQFYRDSYAEFYFSTPHPAMDYRRGSDIHKRAKRLFGFIRPILDAKGKRAPTVFDAGCGSGVLLHLFRKVYPTSILYGAELNPALARYAAKRNDAIVYDGGIEEAVSSGTARRGSFDVIILNHVLEHLHDPVGQLGTLRELLKPNGHLLVELPDITSPYWRDPYEMFHIAHLYHFSPTTLRGVLNRGGFNVIREFPAKLSVNPWAIAVACESKLDLLDSRDPFESLSRDRFEELFAKIQAVICAKGFSKSLRRAMRAIPPVRFVRQAFAYCWDYGFRMAFAKASHVLADALATAAYPVLYPFLRLRWRVARIANNPVYEKALRSKRVLILGSGPSAAELETIPNDVVVMTCNRGLRLLVEKRIPHALDIFVCTESRMQRLPMITEWLSELKTTTIFMDHPGFIRKDKKLRDHYSEVRYEDGRDNFFLSDMIAPERVRNLRGKSRHPWTSTSIRQMLIALHYQAREVYLCGVDLGREGYFWGVSDASWDHDDIDENVLKIASTKHRNLYCLSKASPITQYISHKSFDSPAYETEVANS